MRKFESPELTFYYPENWNLFVNDGDEHSGEEETNEVTLQSPGSSQLTIALYDLEDDTKDLLSRTLDALEAEYDDIEIEEADDELGSTTLRGYDATFFYLDLLVVAELRMIERASDKILLLLQSESRELEENREVFDAIITSMIHPDILESNN